VKPSEPNQEPPEGVASLIAEARVGSLPALGRLLEMCRAYLLGVANRELDSQLQAKAGASDLVQEAFVEAQRIFARFQGNTADELLAWLRAILLNKLSDFERHFRATGKRQVGREVALDQGSEARPPGDLLQGDAPTPSSLAAREELSEAVRLAMARLPEHYRQVLVWRQWEDLPFEEIGRRLNRTMDAARMLWWRALERLQQELEKPL
jgi:RNA polymerase sigma-70 factor (ECF subfamily)